MSIIAPRPVYQKGAKPAPKVRKGMRRVAKGKKASSDCPIMESAEGQPCLADWCGCNGSTDTTCLRHVRKFAIAGMGQKPPNFMGFYGCDKAERLFENNKDQHWTWRGICQAVVLTQMILHRKGLLLIGQGEPQ